MKVTSPRATDLHSRMSTFVRSGEDDVSNEWDDDGRYASATPAVAIPYAGD